MTSESKRFRRKKETRGGAPLGVGLVLGALTCVGACSASQDEEGPGPASPPPAMKIIGGQPAPVCAWPSTVRVQGATSCTGTLIHPTVVTTAAHCIDGSGSQATISFGDRSEPGAFSVTGRCTVGARGERGVSTGSDWAYCVLPEDDRLDEVPITPPLVGCEAEMFLQPGARGWIVGFGATRPPSRWGSGGYGKHEVEVEINQLDKQGPATIDVGDADVGACHGDSGGPLYVELVDADGSYGFRVAGSVSGPGASRCDCTCSTSFVDIDQHVRAIESNEGIDVTPCTADDGSWEPGPECDAMLADPGRGTGSWPACEVTRTTTPIASCGAPFEPELDAGGADGGAVTEGGVDAGAEAGGPDASIAEAGIPSDDGGDEAGARAPVPMEPAPEGGSPPVAGGGADDASSNGFGVSTSGTRPFADAGGSPPGSPPPYSGGRCSAGAGSLPRWPSAPSLAFVVPAWLIVRRRLRRCSLSKG